MDQKSLVMHLVSKTVSEVAPEETILLDGYDPAIDRYGETARGPRGLGIETAVVLVLPYLYKFFDAFITRIASQLADESTALVKKWLASGGVEFDQHARAIIGKALLDAGLPESKLQDVLASVAEVLLKDGINVNEK